MTTDAREGDTITMTLPVLPEPTRPAPVTPSRWAWARLSAVIAGAVAIVVTAWPQIEAAAWYAAVAR
ncbi:hypothetical protein [Frankia sp. Cj3]|uniref:hypothetical protein n=1 Tax=Frankia sp. Cj3 TaxID=2880976 RepID=UPI001EF5220D|nr:hypothetical protein [Frankia sp. Cj3]